jgi:hypothetical protein
MPPARRAMEGGEEGGSVLPPAAAALHCQEGPSRPAPCPTLDPRGAGAVGSWDRACDNCAPPSGEWRREEGLGRGGREGARRAPGAVRDFVRSARRAREETGGREECS